MLVTNKFQTSLYRNGLPPEFEVVKIDLESLKDSTLRRLLRDLEKQLELDQARLTEADRDTTESYLVKILKDEHFETNDIEGTDGRTKTLIVLGSKSGMLSGRVFNSSNVGKFVVDHTQFSDKYPIFIDSSVIKFAEQGEEKLKRQREETFSFAPEVKKEKVETVSDLQAVWQEQEQEFMAEIGDLKSRYDGAVEQNQQILEAAQNNEAILQDRVNALMSKVRELEVTKMDEDEIEVENAENDQLEALKVVNEQLKQKIEDLSKEEVKPHQTQDPKIMGMFDSFMKFAEEGKIDEIENMVTELEVENKSRISKLTLAQFGISPWNPNTTSFLDYIFSFRVAMKARDKMDAKTTQLLFSALPAKYSYIRPLIGGQQDYNPDDYSETEARIIRLICGGPEKIFSEFLNLQKRKDENFLQYFQKLKDYYFFSNKTVLKDLEKDSTAYRLIKDKLCKAYPNRFLPEFKRRIEDKTELNELFGALLDMRENFPESEEYNRDNDMEINVLRTQNKDWQKNVKCYKCGRRGHVQRDCYAKREAKTKKSGSNSWRGRKKK